MMIFAEIIPVNSVNHALIASLAACPIPDATTRYWVAGILAVMGAAPDILTYIEDTVAGVRWISYNKYHGAAPWWLLIMPPYALHVALDRLFHKPEGGWYPWAYVVDLLALFALILLTYNYLI